MKRRSSHLPTSLFPMLAVLVSMLGALILLLLTASRQAQISQDLERRAQASLLRISLQQQKLALAKRRNEAPQPLPARKTYAPIPALPALDLPELDLEPLPALPKHSDPRFGLAQRKQELATKRAELQARIAAAGETKLDPSAAIRKRLGLAKQELAGLQELLTQQKTATTQLNDQREEMQSRKRLLVANSSHVQNRYAIVPYLGPNGTKRRPIYFECQAKNIRLQPEGVDITADLIEKTSSRSNLLANMVKTLCVELNSDPADGEPYPVLIVRPDGIAAYYIAQYALRAVGVQIGYELIPSDMILAFDPPDPRVRKIAEEAIADALAAPERNSGYASSGKGEGRGGYGSAEGDGEAGSSPTPNGRRGRGQGGRNNLSMYRGGLSGSFATSESSQTQSGEPRVLIAPNGNGSGNVRNGVNDNSGPAGPLQSASGISTGRTPPSSLANTERIAPMSESRSAVTLAKPTNGNRYLNETGLFAKETLQQGTSKGTQNSSANQAERTSPPMIGEFQRDSTVAQQYAREFPTKPVVAVMSKRNSDFRSPDKTRDDSAPRPTEAQGYSDTVRALTANRNGNGGLDDVSEEFAMLERPIRNLPTVARNIRIECHDRKLVVLPSMTTISFEQSNREVVRALLEEVEKQRRSWQTPGRTMRWRPALVFLVEPEANAEYYKIWSLLIGSQLEISSQPWEATAFPSDLSIRDGEMTADPSQTVGIRNE